MDSVTGRPGQWTPRVALSAGPKYLGIVEALAADLGAGRLSAGDRLPPQRAIAAALGVDLTTVTRAFNVARSRGLIEATTGRGSFISARAAAQPDPSLPELPSIDLSLNIPPQPEAARLSTRLPEAIEAVLSRQGGLAHLNYQESGGSEPDRTAGADYLSRRIPGLPPERVLVSAGSQSALHAICRVVAKPGDTIAAGALTYPGIRSVAMHLGLGLAPLAMDGEGIVPEAFTEECERRRPAALYVIPSIDNPTTATLGEARRRQLAEIARRHGVPIIEDDPYSNLLPEPPTALAALAPELTWHVATLSKCVTPALRIAYVAAPDTASAAAAAGVLRAATLMAPPLMAAVASFWIGSGIIDEITAAIRAESHARQDIARIALPGRGIAATADGHHLWLALPGDWRAMEFAYHAERSGLSIVPSGAFSIAPPAPEAVRISLGAAGSRAILRTALARLDSMLSKPPISARAVV
jgi:DNA-binding transcriptional MocR family regulator